MSHSPLARSQSATFPWNFHLMQSGTDTTVGCSSFLPMMESREHLLLRPSELIWFSPPRRQFFRFSLTLWITAYTPNKFLFFASVSWDLSCVSPRSPQRIRCCWGKVCCPSDSPSLVGVILGFLEFYQFNHSVVSDSLQPHEPKHTRPPCPSPTPRVHPNLCPLSWWCHPTISFSVVPFFSCLQLFPTSGSFPISQLFSSDGQNIGVSASTSVLPKNTQDWSPLGWTGWITWQSKGLSRVFSNTTVQKHQFFSTQFSL